MSATEDGLKRTPRDTVVGTFVDKYGDERQIKIRGKRSLRVGRDTETVALKMGRVAGVLIGARIKERRLAAGMQLAELCERAGLVSATPKSRMWEIENASRYDGIRMGTLFAIAHALGCEARQLIPTVREVSEAAGVELSQETVERLA